MRQACISKEWVISLRVKDTLGTIARGIAVTWTSLLSTAGAVKRTSTNSKNMFKDKKTKIIKIHSSYKKNWSTSIKITRISVYEFFFSKVQIMF